MFYVLEADSLTHYGILGMKWGIRRYQNPDGSLTEAGRRRYNTGDPEKMSAKQRAKYETAKKAAINSGNAHEVSKFSKNLTPEEMARAFQRINDEQKLSDLRAKETASGKQKVKDVADTVGQLAIGAESAVRVYNVVAKANNAFSDDKKLPVIGDGNKTLDKLKQEQLAFTLESQKRKHLWEREDRAEKKAKERAEADEAKAAVNKAEQERRAEEERRKSEPDMTYHYHGDPRNATRVAETSDAGKQWVTLLLPEPAIGGTTWNYVSVDRNSSAYQEAQRVIDDSEDLPWAILDADYEIIR